MVTEGEVPHLNISINKRKGLKYQIIFIYKKTTNIIRSHGSMAPTTNTVPDQLVITKIGPRKQSLFSAPPSFQGKQQARNPPIIHIRVSAATLT